LLVFMFLSEEISLRSCEAGGTLLELRFLLAFSVGSHLVD
jgi:hypothetical protein